MKTLIAIFAIVLAGCGAQPSSPAAAGFVEPPPSATHLTCNRTVGNTDYYFFIEETLEKDQKWVECRVNAAGNVTGSAHIFDDLDPEFETAECDALVNPGTDHKYRFLDDNGTRSAYEYNNFAQAPVSGGVFQPGECVLENVETTIHF